jgi:hypothetical protein
VPPSDNPDDRGDDHGAAIGELRGQLADALEEIRGLREDVKRAKTPTAKREAREDVRDAEEDLEDVLRRNGYRLTRRDLDAIVDQREDDVFRQRMDRWLKDRREAGDPDDDAGTGGKGERGRSGGKKNETENDRAPQADEHWLR